MKEYDTLYEVINDLAAQGYTHDFNVKNHCDVCRDLDMLNHPENFKIDEIYRFEGMTNPDDNSILYAISSINGIKGVLVNAYGVYADGEVSNLVKKIKDSFI